MFATDVAAVARSASADALEPARCPGMVGSARSHRGNSMVRRARQKARQDVLANLRARHGYAPGYGVRRCAKARTRRVSAVAARVFSQRTPLVVVQISRIGRCSRRDVRALRLGQALRSRDIVAESSGHRLYRQVASEMSAAMFAGLLQRCDARAC